MLMKKKTSEEQKKYFKQYRLDNIDDIKRKGKEYYQRKKRVHNH